MPTYDYVCDECDHAFELFQQMSDGVKRKCPECGKLSLRRLVGTGAGVIFKGSGFYQTDYRSDAYTKAAEADKKGASGDKKDTKKDAKKDAKKDGAGAKASDSKPKASDSKSKSKDSK